ncbi:MAG: PfkB family carbohydrate kinase [Anaerolineae bacterium]
MLFLVGPSACDRFLAEDKVFPGGGALNMSYHWQQLDLTFTLLTRFGSDETSLFQTYFKQNEIRYLPKSAVKTGPSAGIDVMIQDDRQPWMDNYDEGVTADFSLDDHERTLLKKADWAHFILVEGLITELEAMGKSGELENVQISADFFDFRHFTIERFCQLMRWVDIAFVGWPKEEDHPTVAAIRECAHDQEKLIVLTMGSRGVQVFDGRKGSATFDNFFEVQAKEVFGTTVGCGDAFAAYFLAEWQQSQDLNKAIAHANLGGGLATEWFHALPDNAYR